VRSGSFTLAAAVAAVLLGGCAVYHAALPTNPSEALCRTEVESGVTDMLRGHTSQEWPGPAIEGLDASPYLEIHLPDDERTFHAVIVARAGVCYVALRHRYANHATTFVLGSDTRGLPHCTCDPNRVAAGTL